MALSNVGLQALGFFYRIALSRFAGAQGLGVYRLVFSAYAVVNAASLAGVTMACSRLGAAKLAQGRPEQIRPLARFAVGIFVMIFTLCASVVLPAHTFIATRLLGDVRTAAALPIMLICLFLTGFENIIKSLFVGTGRVQYAAVSETGEQIVRIVAVITLLALFGKGDYGRIAALIMLGMAVSECFSSSFLGILYRKHFGKLARTRADPGLLRHVLDIAAPLSIAAVFINLISSAGSVILPQRLVASGMGEAEALSALGVISGMASPLILLPIALISAVGTVLVPSITAAQARGDMPRVRALTDKAMTVTGLIAIPATAALVPLSPSLARVCFGQTIPLPYMALLGAAAVFGYYQMMTASLLGGIGAQRRAAIAAVCGEVLQLGLTWVLAARSELQIYGYILSMLISPLPVVLANLWGLRRKTGYRLRLGHTLVVPLLCGATVWLWVRVFYTALLGIAGSQWLAVLLAACSAALLDWALLQLLGVDVRSYIARRVTRSSRTGIFTFL